MKKLMTQLIAIDDDFHAALKFMSSFPNEKRGMKAIVQEALMKSTGFTKVLTETRSRLGIKQGGGKH